MARKYRLAIVSSHVIQYTAPLYRRLAQEPQLDVTVFYCSDQGAREYVDRGFGTPVKWDTNLLDGYRYKILPNLVHSDVAGFASLVNPSIIRELRRGHFDAVWINGYTHLSNWLALVAARRSRTPVFYRSESSLTLDTRTRRPLPVRLLKSSILRFLFGRVDRFLAIGSLNREFYLHFGARPEQIAAVPYAVDNAYFAQLTDEYRKRRDALRAEIGIGPNDVVFLFAAKLIPKKEPLAVLEAYRRIQPSPNTALIMTGEGELRPQIEAFIGDQGLRSAHMTGFVNQSELPRLYAISDVLLRADGLYAGDWGLTVNEAMAARLAVISTDAIGATRDLVHDGENGFVIRFGDLDDLTRAMQTLAADPQRCRAMGQRSAEIISHWSYEECVRGVLEALASLPSGGNGAR